MGKDEKYNYGVVLDAGSSGTRVYIYKWLKNADARKETGVREMKSLPKLETDEKWTKKVHPGVSTFGGKPELVGTDHLKELLEHALKYVPSDEVQYTPFFMLATAGVRLLPDDQRDNLLRSVCSYVQSETSFLLPDCGLHIKVITGETEGLYGWIAANYLLGAFDEADKHDHGKGHHTYGFLDMGGASAQIAFAPNTTEAQKHANDLKLVRFRAVDGTLQEHKVFVTTWLGFGVNEARKRYVKALVDAVGSSGVVEMPDPCLPIGLLMTPDGKVISVAAGIEPTEGHLIGTGKFDECLRQTNPLLAKDAPCLDEPCLINGVHVPAIDFDVNHFIGISEYWHTTHEIFEMAYKDKSYDFNTYQARVKEFCEQNWSDIQTHVKDHEYGKKVDEQTAYEVCFKASWLINVLHDGIGIPRVGIENTAGTHNGTQELIESGKEKGYLDAFQAVNKIHKQEVSWTMGPILLYACAEIPAMSGASTPVGFGSNEPGNAISTDFQYPGGGRLQSVPPEINDHTPLTASESSQTITNKLGSSIPGFKSDSSHRVPGFVFFLLIIIIACFYLCGRERRSRFYTSYLHPGGKAGRLTSHLSPFFHRILGRRASAEYARGLEDGTSTRLYDPSTFELDNVDDDLDDHDLSAFKQSSGAYTPTQRTAAIFSSPTLSSRPKLGNSKSSLAHAHLGGLSSSGGRLSPDIMDRRGLVVRTESREKLSDIGERISRSGSLSPTRLREKGTRIN